MFLVFLSRFPNKTPTPVLATNNFQTARKSSIVFEMTSNLQTHPQIG